MRAEIHIGVVLSLTGPGASLGVVANTLVLALAAATTSTLLGFGLAGLGLARRRAGK